MVMIKKNEIPAIIKFYLQNYNDIFTEQTFFIEDNCNKFYPAQMKLTLIDKNFDDEDWDYFYSETMPEIEEFSEEVGKYITLKFINYQNSIYLQINK